MTINVVCRRDAINRNRLAPLALVFTHDRRRKFVGLGISEALVHWDFDKQQPTADCPDRAEIQFQITSKIREYEKKIKKLEVLEIPVTFDTLFEQNGKRINCTVGEYFKQIIERLEKVEKYSSASKHKVTLVLVSQFRSVNMRFDELDLTYLREFEIFLSQKGNVNNSCNYAAFQYCRLYLIEILHQTTTHCKCIQFTLCCILSKFYIKPQLAELPFDTVFSCILSKFYIKPQRRGLRNLRHSSCILSKFYIKPQRRDRGREIEAVVSYRNSTSNHNGSVDVLPGRPVVSYRNSTSNHNVWLAKATHKRLYLIEILHQTTTRQPQVSTLLSLYLIEILHQTTTFQSVDVFGLGLYLIEILHQTTTVRDFLLAGFLLYLIEILHQTTTTIPIVCVAKTLYLIEILHQTTTIYQPIDDTSKLYLIEILHQTTTPRQTIMRRYGCILSKFYIKPQPFPLALFASMRLYLIEILHQTTTMSRSLDQF